MPKWALSDVQGEGKRGKTCGIYGHVLHVQGRGGGKTYTRMCSGEGSGKGRGIEHENVHIFAFNVKYREANTKNMSSGMHCSCSLEVEWRGWIR